MKDSSLKNGYMYNTYNIFVYLKYIYGKDIVVQQADVRRLEASYLQGVYGVDPLRALVLGAEEEDVLALQRGRGGGGGAGRAQHQVGLCLAVQQADVRRLEASYLQGVYGVDPLRALVLGAEEEDVLALQRGRGGGGGAGRAQHQVGLCLAVQQADVRRLEASYLQGVYGVDPLRALVLGAEEEDVLALQRGRGGGGGAGRAQHQVGLCLAVQQADVRRLEASYLQGVYGVDPLRALVLGAEEEDVLALQRGRGGGGGAGRAQHQVGLCLAVQQADVRRLEASYLQGVYGVDPLRALVLGAEEEDVLALQRGRGGGGGAGRAQHQVGLCLAVQQADVRRLEASYLQGVYGVDPLRALVLGAEEEDVLALQRGRGGGGGAGRARAHAQHQVGLCLAVQQADVRRLEASYLQGVYGVDPLRALVLGAEEEDVLALQRGRGGGGGGAGRAQHQVGLCLAVQQADVRRLEASYLQGVYGVDPLPPGWSVSSSPAGGRTPAGSIVPARRVWSRSTACARTRS
ncbi:hypothetical protein ACJJTC_015349 [Scirpophaga incertulas]